MRQMDDDLIVRIATIQAIVVSLLFTAATMLKIQGQGMGLQVSFFVSQSLSKEISIVNLLLNKLCFRCVMEFC